VLTKRDLAEGLLIQIQDCNNVRKRSGGSLQSQTRRDFRLSRLGRKKLETKSGQQMYSLESNHTLKGGSPVFTDTALEPDVFVFLSYFPCSTRITTISFSHFLIPSCHVLTPKLDHTVLQIR
jgi:hypothetical protein